MTLGGPGPDLDVAIVGDGPAGLALAAACRHIGLTVVVLGDGRPWPATYGVWRDELPDLPDACFGHVSPAPVVHGHRHHVLDRPYGIVDNVALRDHLAKGVDARAERAERLQHFTWGTRVRTSNATIDARYVVDATGQPAALLTRPDPGAAHSGQSAYGVVVADRPSPFDDTVTLMDLRGLPGPTTTVPTFGYVVPVADGWLVEETVLVARPMADPSTLRDRLAARIGIDGETTVAAAARTERVTIPMGSRLPSRRDPVIGFGAAAGFVHPVSGFSVTASLRAAPRVAAALADHVDAARPDPGAVWDAVWPRQIRRTRRLHQYGMQVLLQLGPTELAGFFDAFFELPVVVWAPYLRVDATPVEVSRAMTAVLRRLPWALRRRLVANPFGS